MALSVMWKLGGEGFTFEAAIDEEPLTEIGLRIPYADLDEPDLELDHTVDRLSKAMMNEIVDRSERLQRD